MIVRVFKALAVAGLPLILAGCGAGFQQVEAPRFTETFTPPPLPAPATVEGSLSGGDTVDAFAPRPGYTYATIGGGDGVQVEYFSPDGRAFLWYPGDEKVVPGLYRYNVTDDSMEGRRLSRIQFKYFRYRDDGSLRLAGASWDGQGIAGYQSGVISYVWGDPFGLADRIEVPFRRERCQLPPPMVALKDTGGWIC